MATTRRQRQVAELLHQEISQLIQYRSQDPRLGFITVTGVKVSPDLRLARVYVSVLGDKAETQKALEGLASAAGYLRHELGQLVSLRYVPQLSFELDTSLEHSMRIESLLDSIEEARTNEPDIADNSAEAEAEDE